MSGEEIASYILMFGFSVFLMIWCLINREPKRKSVYKSSETALQKDVDIIYDLIMESIDNNYNFLKTFELLKSRFGFDMQVNENNKTENMALYYSDTIRLFNEMRDFYVKQYHKNSQGGYYV